MIAAVDGVEIRVRVQPRAKSDAVVGERDGAWVVRVRAPPLDGRANAALCELIARRVGVRIRDVSVVHGASSRDKLLRVEGVTAAALREAMLGG